MKELAGPDALDGTAVKRRIGCLLLALSGAALAGSPRMPMAARFEDSQSYRGGSRARL